MLVHANGTCWNRWSRRPPSPNKVRPKPLEYPALATFILTVQRSIHGHHARFIVGIQSELGSHGRVRFIANIAPRVLFVSRGCSVGLPVRESRVGDKGVCRVSVGRGPIHDIPPKWPRGDVRISIARVGSIFVCGHETFGAAWVGRFAAIHEPFAYIGDIAFGTCENEFRTSVAPARVFGGFRGVGHGTFRGVVAIHIKPHFLPYILRVTCVTLGICIRFVLIVVGLARDIIVPPI